MSFTTKDNVLTLGDSGSFDNIISESKIPVMVDFYADWCPPCKQLIPLLEKKAAENKGFLLLKVNVDTNGEIAERFNVGSIPHVFLLHNGEVVNQFMGYNEGGVNKMIKNIEEIKNKI